MSGTLTRGRAIVLGMLITACLAVGGWTIARMSLREGAFRQTFELRVGFAQVHDVGRGTPVRIRGVDAGQVVAIEYPEIDSEDEPSKVWLRLQIDTQFAGRIYADAKATIHAKGLLSNNVIAIHPGSPRAGPLFGDELPSVEPTDMAQVANHLQAVASRAESLMSDLQNSQGTIHRLLKDDGLYNDIRKLAQDTQKAVQKADTAIVALKEELNSVRSFIKASEDTIRTVEQNAEAIKKLPVVRSYVEDAAKILIRPECDRQREVLKLDDLFEEGTSILTSAGREKLAATAAWLNGNPHKKSEIVVLCALDTRITDITSAHGKTLTQKQSDTIVEFLREQGVHKLGFWSRRTVTGLGLGMSPSPVVEKESLPPNHAQILLFTPRE